MILELLEFASIWTVRESLGRPKVHFTVGPHEKYLPSITNSSCYCLSPVSIIIPDT